MPKLDFRRFKKHKSEFSLPCFASRGYQYRYVGDFILLLEVRASINERDARHLIPGTKESGTGVVDVKRKWLLIFTKWTFRFLPPLDDSSLILHWRDSPRVSILYPETNLLRERQSVEVTDRRDGGLALEQGLGSLQVVISRVSVGTVFDSGSLTVCSFWRVTDS